MSDDKPSDSTVKVQAKVDEQAKKTIGQRRINFLWEATQAIIAISVSLTTLSVCASLILKGEVSTGAFLLLSNVFFLVVGTYFQRTNHTKSSSGSGEREEDHR